MTIHAGYPQTHARRAPDDAEIRGQITGYWTSTPDELRWEPRYIPTGALLVDERSTTADGVAEALDLMAIDGQWRPLSHAAALTYVHTAGMARGETWYFVTFGSSGRIVYECRPPLGELAYDEIERRFGDVARDRAREDWPAILVRVSRVDGTAGDGR